MRELNATTRFRFTTLFRVERSRLVGVWVHDRENPRVNGGVPAEAPACCYRAADMVQPPRRARARDADARWHDTLALRLRDGTLLGVVCHSDARPRLADDLAWLECEPMVAAIAHWLAALRWPARAGARVSAIPAP